MPVFLLIFIPCLTFTVQTIAMKSVHARILRQNLLITGILSALIAAGFGVYALFAETHFSPLTFVLGAVFGAVYVTTLVSYYYAMQTGPLSYSSFFYSASMLIPALAGLLIWKEPFTWQAGAGIALFLAAFYLVSVPGAAKGQKISGKWLLFCFMSWLFNGGCSLSVKAHQMAMEGREGNEMLLVGYCTAALLSFGCTPYCARSRGRPAILRWSKPARCRWCWRRRATAAATRWCPTSRRGWTALTFIPSCWAGC